MRCLCLFAMVLCSGCVTRLITIKSHPQAALVYLNDQEIGRTPLTVQFDHYGVYDVRVEAEGYKSLWTQKKAKSPLWDLPGPDLIAETIPGMKSHIEWYFALELYPKPNDEALLERSSQMRALSNQPTQQETK